MSSDRIEFKRLVKDVVESSKGPKHSDTVGLLQKLRGHGVTEDLLKETKAGLAVGKLRSHANAQVAETAKEVVRRWKAEVEGQKSEKKAGSSSPSGGAKKVNPKPIQTSVPGSTSSKSPAPATAGPHTPLSPSLVRTTATDGVKLNDSGDEKRDTCMRLLYDALASDSTAPSDQIAKIARKIEEQVLSLNKNNSGNPYRTKIRSLYLNLKEKSNPGLREAVVSGELSVPRLCTMSVQEMASEERQAESKRIEEQNLFKAKGAEEAGAETDAFKCFRCGLRKTRYTQAQTRSADEPMTTFVTCVNCGNRWKFS
ncbi:transcription elongation factor [Dacryopinax primogenitus]|uniref:Transcription elongation factor n=1 Tax=Dacryopinax primogenitus (strain DJM 731) TaxID=1858805 RepID=M5FSN8_DACPD|nr:transcription elongation factor [Dacryopinax primogenitus]EJT98229.1 transcription elongation factor [Dacryopinax primogenitus]